MWPVIPVFALLALLIGVMTAALDDSKAATENGEASTIASNMIVYSKYVMKYAAANPTLTQSNVSDVALGIPYWFVHTPNVKNYVANGRGYVYYPIPLSGPTSGANVAATPQIPALSGVIAKQTLNAYTTGIVTNGVLVDATTGPQPSIPIPPQIINGSEVITN